MNRINTLVFIVGLSIALLWGGLRYVLNAPDDDTVAEGEVEPASITATIKESSGVVRREVVLMGSLFNFAVDAPSDVANAALDAVVVRMQALEAELSSWRQGSDVRKLNAAAGRQAVPVGDDTFELLRLAKQLHVQTEGSFDVTIGPVWDLWPFRDPRRAIPTRREIDAALPLVDSSLIILDEDTRTAFLSRSGMSVNFGAIGKGYAARLAAEVFAAHGIENAAISAGGDLYLRGRKRNGPWIVEIENPRWPGRYLERFAATDIAVATSGDSKRLLSRGGKDYGHIIDPRSGSPAQGTQSVTILTADPVVADVFATAVSVMGADEGLRWIEKQADVEALIVDADGLAHPSSGWKRAIHESRKQASEVDQSLIPRFLEGDTMIVAGRLTRLKNDKPVKDFSRPVVGHSGAPSIPLLSKRGSLNRQVGKMVDIPGGEFVSANNQRGYTEPYSLDRTEVTNRAYQVFLASIVDDPHQFCHPDEPLDKDHTPRYWASDWQPSLLRRRAAGAIAPFDLDTFRDPGKPVVGIDWWDAYAFTHWAGKRLPTRSEWTKAAGGTQGSRWPWGDKWDPALANTGGEMNGERDGHIYAAPVDAFVKGASVFGNLNMAGNAAEWTVEGFTMGGSSASSPSGVATTAAKIRDPGYRSFDTGLRAAAEVK